MTKDWKLYAQHMLDCIRKIKLIYDRGNIETDFVLYDATLRNLQTLSESVAHLPEHLKSQYEEVNWRGISGFRNIIVHDYLGDIDPQTIQHVVRDYIPSLEIVIKQMLK